MKAEWLAAHVLPAAFALLPSRLDSLEARAMVTAICLQESALKHRRQIRGPARGLAQFELIGCTEVMTGHATRDVAATVLDALLYAGASDLEVHSALEHNDVLAVCFARLLLWGDPARLPPEHDAESGWAYYLRRWRPGKPRHEKWAANWEAAWSAVDP